MAVAIPLLSIAGGVSAGMAVAGGAALTIGSAMSIMGGLVSGLGLVSKDKKFQRIGAVLSMAGSLANGVQKMAGAATQTASSSVADTAKLMTDGAAPGTESLLAGGEAAQAAEMPSLAQRFAQPAPTALDSLTGIDTTSGTVMSPGGGGMGLAAPGATADALGFGTGTGPASQLAGGVTMPSSAMPSLLEQAAASMTQGDIAAANKSASLMAGTGPSLWDRVTGAAKGVHNWIETNPKAASFYAQTAAGLASAYGQQRAEDYQRSLYDRARTNMNSPVRLTFTPGG